MIRKIESKNCDIKNIQSFDLNKDGKIDKTELKEAAKVASKWAVSSLVNSKNWFYYGAGKPVGPKVGRDR